MLEKPWLTVGIVIGLLLVCAWIGWAVHVGGDQGGREAVGVLIAWPAIAAVIALISVPFVWAFGVIRASHPRSPGDSGLRSPETPAADETGSRESGSTEATETG